MPRSETSPCIPEIDSLKFGAPELIRPTSAERDLHLYKSALFPGIYNVGLIKFCRKKDDILPGLSYPSCCIRWRKNTAPYERCGDATVKGNEHAFSERKISARYGVVSPCEIRDISPNSHFCTLAHLFRGRPRMNRVSLYHQKHPFDSLYSFSWTSW